MSTIKAQNFQDPTTEKSVDAAYVTDGVAKAWVIANQTGTQAIQDSFNVSSITDAALGATSVNLTSAMVDAEYVWPCGGGGASSLDYGAPDFIGFAPTASQFTIRGRLSSNGGQVDLTRAMATVSGDLA